MMQQYTYTLKDFPRLAVYPQLSLCNLQYATTCKAEGSSACPIYLQLPLLPLQLLASSTPVFSLQQIRQCLLSPFFPSLPSAS